MRAKWWTWVWLEHKNKIIFFLVCASCPLSKHWRPIYPQCSNSLFRTISTRVPSHYIPVHQFFFFKYFLAIHEVFGPPHFRFPSIFLYSINCNVSYCSRDIYVSGTVDLPPLFDHDPSRVPASFLNSRIPSFVIPYGNQS